MLSAKLYDDGIVIIESEHLKVLKTNYLSNIFKPYKTDKLTILTGFEPD